MFIRRRSGARARPRVISISAAVKMQRKYLIEIDYMRSRLLSA